MADRRALRKRLLASVVLFIIGVMLFVLALFFYIRGLQWANEFSGVAGLFVAIAALISPLANKMFDLLRQPSGDLAVVTAEQAAERLAVALEVQWARQEELRMVNNPWPLPVRWQVTDQARAAMRGVSWSDLGKPHHPVTASSVASSFDNVGGLLTARLPWRRLVVLGGAGSGKTMLAVRIARELLSGRAKDDPIPVLLTVATWSPRQQTLLDFAAAQLIRDYPALGAFISLGSSELVTIAYALLATRKLLLVLDGIDEMPAHLRSEALHRISAMPPDTPLVVTSRTAEYVQAVENRERGLPRAAVVELLPLRLSDIRTYLVEATAPPESRWQPVFAHLAQGKDRELAEVLQTPLMIWLTRTVYAEAKAAPGDLIPIAVDGGREAVEEHLMSRLIGAVYMPGDHSSATSARWSTQSAEKWLRFVAFHLRAEKTLNFAWWDLNRRAPRIVHGIIGGIPIGAPIALVVGIAVGIAKGPLSGLTDGLAAGVGVSLMGGLPGGLSSWRQMRPARIEVRIRGNLGFLGGRLVLGLLFGFGFGIVIGLPTVFIYGLHYGVLVALALGLAIGSALTLRQLFNADSDISTAVSPSSILHDDTRSAIVQASMGCIGLGLGAGIALYVTSRFGATTGIAIGVAYGLAYGITLAVAYRSSGLTTPAFLPFMIARTWLAVQRKLPWKLMDFLEDAHKLGVLRQQGAVYQFRHLRLQAYLEANAARSRFQPQQDLYPGTKSLPRHSVNECHAMTDACCKYRQAFSANEVWQLTRYSQAAVHAESDSAAELRWSLAKISLGQSRCPG
jgi:NACHT domain